MKISKTSRDHKKGRAPKTTAFYLVGVCVCGWMIIGAADAHAQNQHEMNQQAEAEFEKADAQLNRVYKKILAELDAEAQAKLKAAQRAWVVFRDAEAEYEADQDARGGSMYPMLYAGTRAQLTKARIKELNGARGKP